MPTDLRGSRERPSRQRFGVRLHPATAPSIIETEVAGRLRATTSALMKFSPYNNRHDNAGSPASPDMPRRFDARRHHPPEQVNCLSTNLRFTRLRLTKNVSSLR
jgi:hypothetical protein